MTPSIPALTSDERERVERVELLARSGAEGARELEALLIDSSWVVRRAVVAALARLGASALPGLCDILVHHRDNEARLAATVDVLAATTANVDREMLALTESPDPAVACDAIQVLGRRRSVAALPRLIELSTHADDNVAVSALEALGRLGGVDTVDALIAAVEAKHFFRTFPALDALGRTGDVRAVKPLTALLQDPLYTAEAARALGHSGQEAAVAPLAELLARPGSAIVRIAAVALAELRERYEARYGETPAIARALASAAAAGVASARIASALPGAGTAEIVAFTRVFAWLGDPLATTELIELVTEPDPIGAAAVSALRRIGGPSTPFVLASIVEGNSARRARLLPILAPAYKQSDALVVCLDDPDPDVRTRACEALARLGDTTAVGALFRLIGDRDARVSQAAAAAIQSLGSLETKRLALEQARSSDPRTRRAALRILSYFGYPEGLDILVEAMNDDDDKIREAAIYGLPLIDDPKAVEALLASATHADAKTRAAIIRALGQTTAAPEVVNALERALRDDDAWVRYYATQAFGRLKVEASAPWLVARVTDPSGQVRVAAVESLAHLKDNLAEQALVDAARSSDPDMRRAALLGLGISRRPGALPLLKEGAVSSDAATRLVAIGALAELESPEVIPALAHAASDPDEGVRSAAIGYLSTRPTDDATSALLAQLSTSSVRDRILDALAVGADQRVETVLGALEGADADRSTLYVSALALMRRPSSQAALASLLTSSNVHARRAAATALAAVGTTEAREALVRAGTTDPDSDVRRICATVLSST